LVIWQGNRGLDRLDDVLRRLEATECAPVPATEIREQLGLATIVRELVLEVAHAAKRRPLRNQLRRKGDRFLAQAALRDDGIENPEILRLGGADRAPAGDEIKSDRGAGDARQPLGSAGAGK